jgi:hypothetical protein
MIAMDRHRFLDAMTRVELPRGQSHRLMAGRRSLVIGLHKQSRSCASGDSFVLCRLSKTLCSTHIDNLNLSLGRLPPY